MIFFLLAKLGNATNQISNCLTELTKKIISYYQEEPSKNFTIYSLTGFTAIIKRINRVLRNLRVLCNICEVCYCTFFVRKVICLLYSRSIHIRELHSLQGKSSSSLERSLGCKQNMNFYAFDVILSGMYNP
jgi:hypothetical protein